MSDDDDTDNDVVTVTIDGSDTITLSDCLTDIDLSYSYGDDMSYSVKTGTTTWYSSSGDSSYGLDALSFGDFSPPKEVKVGDRILNEDKIERLDAMLDIFEQDPEFAERLKTQIAFNRIKKDEIKSD